MKKKTSIIALIALLVVGVIGTSMAFAVSDTTKLKNIEKQAQDTKKSLAEVEAEVDALCDEIDAIDARVDAKKVELDKAKADVKKTKKEMNERQDGLNARLRTMYKNGSIGYLEVILGSHSISEFISNVEMIKRIYKNDQDVLQTLKEQKKVLEKKEAKLQEEQNKLKKLQDEAKAKEEELKARCDKYKSQIAKLEKQAEQVRADIAAKQNPNRKYEGGAFSWPAPSSHIITSNFGWRIHPVYGYGKGHTGVDIGISYGTVVAAASGTVIVAQGGYGGYGNAIVIDHGSGISTLYGHLSQFKVHTGQHVSKGQAIAVSGNTGVSTGPHLHFEVRISGNPVNPMSYF